MKNNSTPKERHKNTPTKQLISTVVARYQAASAREQKAIIRFFNWTIRNAFDRQLKELYIEVRQKTLEAGK